MSVRQRGWLVAIPLGIGAAVVAFLLFKGSGTSSRTGPVDVLGMLAVFGATVFLTLPRQVIRARRATRALLAFSALMFFLMLVEAAHQCTSAQPNCTGGGEPLRAFAAWVIGFVVLGIVWLLTDPRRARRFPRLRRHRR